MSDKQPCTTHSWIYDDMHGGYCEVCGFDHKTREQIDALKANWLADPCWDIETTAGFEAYHNELLEYRKAVQARWNREYQQRLLDKAESLGVPGNTKLAEKFMLLEAKIENLTALVNRATAVY